MRSSVWVSQASGLGMGGRWERSLHGSIPYFQTVSSSFWVGRGVKLQLCFYPYIFLPIQVGTISSSQDSGFTFFKQKLFFKWSSSRNLIRNTDKSRDSSAEFEGELGLAVPTNCPHLRSSGVHGTQTEAHFHRPFPYHSWVLQPCHELLLHFTKSKRPE